jgi:hypothetical protein
MLGQSLDSKFCLLIIQHGSVWATSGQSSIQNSQNSKMTTHMTSEFDCCATTKANQRVCPGYMSSFSASKNCWYKASFLNSVRFMCRVGMGPSNTSQKCSLFGHGGRYVSFSLSKQKTQLPYSLKLVNRHVAA